MARLQPGSPALSPHDEGNRPEEPSPEEQRRGRLPLGGQALEEIPANVVNWRCLDLVSVNILKAKRRAVSAGHARRGRIAGEPTFVLPPWAAVVLVRETNLRWQPSSHTPSLVQNPNSKSPLAHLTLDRFPVGCTLVGSENGTLNTGLVRVDNGSTSA